MRNFPYYISLDNVAPMDPIIECEDLPLTYLNTDGMELVDSIEEYEALPPHFIHTNDVASKFLIPLD